MIISLSNQEEQILQGRTKMIISTIQNMVKPWDMRKVHTLIESEREKIIDQHKNFFDLAIQKGLRDTIRNYFIS